MYRHKQRIEVGASYRPARVTFGSVPMIWSVEEVHRGTDGHEYALLVNTVDRTRRKTLAVAALLDPAFYIRMGE